VRSVDHGRKLSTAPCPGQHRRDRGDDPEEFSANRVWKAAAEGCGAVGMAGRRFLGGSARRQTVSADRFACERGRLPPQCVIQMCLLAGRRILKLTRSFVPSKARLQQKITLSQCVGLSRPNAVADLGASGGSLTFAVLTAARLHRGRGSLSVLAVLNRLMFRCRPDALHAWPRAQEAYCACP
jgi:hypothetical protein